MIQIELFFTPTDVRNRLIPRSTSIVIDVLRFCTSVCFALNSGCKGVYTVLKTKEAHKLKKKLKSKNVLLCGERLGQKIKDFDLGNSPQEYTKRAVKDKLLIFTTTNGTKAIDQVKKAKELIISTFANLNTVIKHLKEKRDTLLMFVCSGRTGYFSLEDTICAGAIIHNLIKYYARNSIGYRISDTAAASRRLYLEYKDDLLGMLRISDHGRYLIGIGSEEDLEYCAEIDSNRVIPVYNKAKGMFTRLNRN